MQHTKGIEWEHHLLFVLGNKKETCLSFALSSQAAHSNIQTDQCSPQQITLFNSFFLVNQKRTTESATNKLLLKVDTFNESFKKAHKLSSSYHLNQSNASQCMQFIELQRENFLKAYWTLFEIYWIETNQIKSSNQTVKGQPVLDMRVIWQMMTVMVVISKWCVVSTKLKLCEFSYGETLLNLQ